LSGKRRIEQSLAGGCGLGRIERLGGVERRREEPSGGESLGRI
jgi:uncharacterized protein YprB with RNaseH-like and TPR domain